MEAEEAAERGRRERNYRKLAEFREVLCGKMNGSIQENVHVIEDIHKDKVILFENTDDRYKKLIDTYYDEWKSFGDGFADFRDVVCDIGSILKDPGNALEAIGQSTFDNADEKGIAYSVSYAVADTATKQRTQQNTVMKQQMQPQRLQNVEMNWLRLQRKQQGMRMRVLQMYGI